MANRILHSVARVGAAIERVTYGDEMHDLISQYAHASLYRDPAKLPHLIKRISRLAARDYFQRADKLGVQAADDIMSAIGRHTSESAARRMAVSKFRQRTAKNLANLTDGLQAAGLHLRADTKAALRQARLGGEDRRQIMLRLAKADRADMASWKQYQKEHRAAVKAETQATERLSKRPGDTKAIGEVEAAKKEQSRVRRNMLGRRSFLARFENATQREMTDTFRVQTRLAQDARFREMGYTDNALFTWVTVSGDGTCPDCSEMHGVTRKHGEFGGTEPGTGWSVCGASCKCILVPEAYSVDNPSLSKPLAAPG